MYQPIINRWSFLGFGAIGGGEDVGWMRGACHT